MTAKKSFTPQNLRSLLGLILAIVIIGGGALFYFEFDQVHQYAISVNHREEDAKASEQQISQLQSLKEALKQNNDLVSKADQLFSTPDAYQTRVLTDLKNYANHAGVSISGTTFGDRSKNSNDYSVDVTLAKPVSYSKLIVFLSSIEGNIPLLQVNSIDLSYVEGGSSDSVQVGDINIGISVH